MGAVPQEGTEAHQVGRRPEVLHCCAIAAACMPTSRSSSAATARCWRRGVVAGANRLAGRAVAQGILLRGSLCCQYVLIGVVGIQEARAGATQEAPVLATLA